MDDETTAEYLENILEEVEAAKNDAEPKNMPVTSKVQHETDEENFGEEEEEFEFQGLKPILIKVINLNQGFPNFFFK